jgi:hypothetical protein
MLQHRKNYNDNITYKRIKRSKMIILHIKELKEE